MPSLLITVTNEPLGYDDSSPVAARNGSFERTSTTGASFASGNDWLKLARRDSSESADTGEAGGGVTGAGLDAHPVKAMQDEKINAAHVEAIRVVVMRFAPAAEDTPGTPTLHEIVHEASNAECVRITDMNDIQALGQVEKIAREAGELILKHYGRVDRLTKTHSAADNEAVTQADRDSQSLIVRRLRDAFPGDGIIGEEDDAGAGITFDVRDPMGRVWVIDPIDGTNNFVAGLGAFCVSIGLLDRGMPVMGVVYNVTRGTMFSGGRGLGAFVDGKPVRAIAGDLSSRSLILLTGTMYDDDGRLPGWALKLMGKIPQKPRILGSAALEGALVAAGIGHVAIQIKSKLWDVAGAAAIAIEAGALVTRPDGSAIFPFDLRGYAGARVPFLIAGPEAHHAMVKLIHDHP